MMPFASSVQFAFAEAAYPEQFHALAATQDSGSQVNTPQPACPTGYPSDVNTRTLGRSGRKQPIRVSHVSPSFVCAGVESWLRALVSHCDPTIMRFVRNVVTEEYAVDHELLQQLGIPYSLGREQAVRDAALDAGDWAPGVGGHWRRWRDLDDNGQLPDVFRSFLLTDSEIQLRLADGTLFHERMRP
jgi:hypothetical protein